MPSLLTGCFTAAKESGLVQKKNLIIFERRAFTQSSTKYIKSSEQLHINTKIHSPSIQIAHFSRFIPSFYLSTLAAFSDQLSTISRFNVAVLEGCCGFSSVRYWQITFDLLPRLLHQLCCSAGFWWVAVPAQTALCFGFLYLWSVTDLIHITSNHVRL